MLDPRSNSLVLGLERHPGVELPVAGPTGVAKTAHRHSQVRRHLSRQESVAEEPHSDLFLFLIRREGQIDRPTGRNTKKKAKQKQKQKQACARSDGPPVEVRRTEVLYFSARWGRHRQSAKTRVPRFSFRFSVRTTRTTRNLENIKMHTEGKKEGGATIDAAIN